MNLANLCARIQGRYQRGMASFLFRRPVEMHNTKPIISFTFDDFPRSAFQTGGAILRDFGLRGTYYASLSLIGQDSPTGVIFSAEDLEALLSQGHELGCHTFTHCHSWATRPTVFESSIMENRHMLTKLLPGAAFRTFSYPISYPRPHTKRKAAANFICCRCGGQTFNAGTIDLSLLRAYFLEKNRDNPGSVKNLIDENNRVRGWLIFATHDVCDMPTRFGCTPAFFEEIVKYAVHSGARILPVVEACEAICAAGS